MTIGNMDETPLFFDMVPGKTVEKKGVKSVRVRTTGSEKRHVTVVLACTASGEMLPPTIVFRGKTDRVLKGLKVPPKFLVARQEKAWMDTPLTLRWVSEIWQRHHRQAESLLVWDSFRCHLDKNVNLKLQNTDTVTAVIPGGCTSVLQPLDVCLNKPFKDLIKQKWLEYMETSVVQQIDEESDEDPLAESDDSDGERDDVLQMKKKRVPLKVKPASRQTIVDWVHWAWQKLQEKPEMIKKSFVVTGITPIPMVQKILKFVVTRGGMLLSQNFR